MSQNNCGHKNSVATLDDYVTRWVWLRYKVMSQDEYGCVTGLCHKMSVVMLEDDVARQVWLL